MALYRLSQILCLGLLCVSGCGQDHSAGQSAPVSKIEVMPPTKAVADVDRRATIVLKQDLVTRFPQNSPGSVVENGLSKNGYDCGPNPSAPIERACLKVVREGVCEVNTIVRTAPYAPEKAQVIRICETRASK
jgi:hypothetical protein